MLIALPQLRAAPQELIRTAADWTTRVAAPEARLEFASPSGVGGALQLIVRDPQRTRVVGGWVRELPPFQQGRRYRFDATARFAAWTTRCARCAR